ILSAPRPAFDYERMFKGEAYMGVTTIRNLPLFGNIERLSTPGRTPPPIDTSKLMRSGMPSSLIQRAYMARHLEMWTQIFTECKPMMRDPNALFVHMNRITEIVAAKPGVSYLLEMILA